MNLKFKIGLLTSLGAIGFTPLLTCACGKSETITVAKRVLKLIINPIYSIDVETYVVNNDNTICYITLPELLSIYYENEQAQITSYNSGVYVYRFFDSLCKIDTINNKISFTNPNQFFARDMFIPYGSEPIKNFQLDEEASKVVHLGQKDKEGYYKAFDLGEYNFDIIDLNGENALIPFEPLSTIFASTNLFANICYDREKLILCNDYTESILSQRKEPPNDQKFLEYNYNCLCFTFDYNYGLKSKRYIKDYDTFFRNATFQIDGKTSTYYDALHSTNGLAYASRALVSIIEGECDDGHSSYMYQPCDSYSDVIYQAEQDYIGPRCLNLMNLTRYYTALFNSKKGNYQWIPNSQIEGEYNFMTVVNGNDASKPKAVLKFDQFTASMDTYYSAAVQKFGPNLDFSNLDVLEFFKDFKTISFKFIVFSSSNMNVK